MPSLFPDSGGKAVIQKQQRIFLSYSHDDVQWLEKIKKFLRPLERDAEIVLWSDTNLRASSHWHAEIQTAISEADAAVLLISQNFLASDYVASNELPQVLSAANQRGLRVFPVILSSSFLRGSPLLTFQAVNSPAAPLDTLSEAEQNRLLTKLVESIDDVLKLSSSGITEEWLDKFRARFVPVQGGTYISGDNELHAKLHGLPEQTATVASFGTGKYVITQAEWVAVMGTQPWFNQKNVRYGNDVPAVWVNWYDANDFVTNINKSDRSFIYRLPTETEWEFAARGGIKGAIERRRFCFGNDPNSLSQYGWYEVNASLRGENFAHPVGDLAPNQLGLHDMHGNVWEWTLDNRDGLRALRGGGFNFTAEGASSAFRVEHKPEVKGEAVGFRLVQERRPE
jgi:formylglycine-generating enzyme required for sulfatase activity